MSETTLLTVLQVAKRLHCCRSHVYTLIKREAFPKPLRLSASKRAWRESDVDAWIVSRNPADIAA